MKVSKFLFTILLLFTAFFAQADPAGDFRAHYGQALKGDAKSQYVVGRLLIEGPDPIKKDTSLGLSFLERSAKSGNEAAANYLIDILTAGTLVQKNLSLAYKILAPYADLEPNKAEKLVKLSILIGKGPTSGDPFVCKAVDKWYSQKSLFQDEKIDCIIAQQQGETTNEKALELIAGKADSDPKAFKRYFDLSIKNIKTVNTIVNLRKKAGNFGVLGNDKSKSSEVRQILKVITDLCIANIDQADIGAADRASLCEMADSSGDLKVRYIISTRKLTGAAPFQLDAPAGLAGLNGIITESAEARDYLRNYYLSTEDTLNLISMSLIYDTRGSKESLDSLAFFKNSARKRFISLEKMKLGDRVELCKRIAATMNEFEAFTYAHFSYYLTQSELRGCMPIRIEADELVALQQARDQLGIKQSTIGLPLSTQPRGDDAVVATQTLTLSSRPAEEQIYKLVAQYIINNECQKAADFFDTNPQYESGFLRKYSPLFYDCARSDPRIAVRLGDLHFRNSNLQEAIENFSLACNSGNLLGCQKILEAAAVYRDLLLDRRINIAYEKLFSFSSKLNADQRISILDYWQVSGTRPQDPLLTSQWLGQLHFAEKNKRGSLRYVDSLLQQKVGFFTDPAALQTGCAFFKEINISFDRKYDVDLYKKLYDKCN
jgi:TPR repeat protein